MGRKLYRRAIHFDLDDKLLQENYPNKSYKRAYEKISSFFMQRNFEHRQYSGYISKDIMSDEQIMKMIRQLAKENEWLLPSLKSMEVTNVLDNYDLKLMLEEVKGNTSNELLENNRVCISLPKAYCSVKEDKFDTSKTFNTMKFPNGTILNGEDISGYVINPKLMHESKFTQNEMVAQYDIGTDEGKVMIKNLKEATSKLVDIKELKEAIDIQKAAYKEMVESQEQNITKAREKDMGEEL